MSYRNPQQALNTKYAAVSAGLKNMFATIGNTADDYYKKKEKDKKKAEKHLKKKMNPFAAEEEKFVKQALEYSSDYKTEAQRESFQSLIEDNLLIIRNQMKKELANQDLTTSEIQIIQQKGAKDLGTLQKEVTAIHLAKLELEEGVKKGYGEDGQYRTGKRDDVSDLLQGVDGGDKFSLYNTSLVTGSNSEEYTLGQASYGMGSYTDTDANGVPIFTQKIDLEEIANVPEGEAFFNSYEIPNAQGLNDFIVNDAINDRRLVNEVERQDAKGKKIKQNVLNPEKAKYFLLNDPAGQGMMDIMFEDGYNDQLGYLRSKKPKEHTQQAWEAIISDEQAANNMTVDFLVEDAILGAKPENIYRERDSQGETQTLVEGFKLDDDELNLFTETADQQ